MLAVRASGSADVYGGQHESTTNGSNLAPTAILSGLRCLDIAIS